jgi:ubiquinone/menaquinone biosynthesis C-methylase UbiE
VKPPKELTHGLQGGVIPSPQAIEVTTSDQTEFGFEPFADTPVYQQLHTETIRGWVETIQSHRSTPLQRLLDLATGKGTIPRLILENWPQKWAMPEVVCLDQSNGALRAAREELKRFPGATLSFVNAPIEEFQLPEASIDLCTWGNGIHYLDAAAQQAALVNIKNVLPIGGWFAFNTAFHLEGKPPETNAFYNQKVRIAVRSLVGIQRDKNVVMPAAGYLPQSHYEDLLQRNGFELCQVRQLVGPLDLDAMEKISGFQHYAAGALRGYPPEVAARALKAAVAPAMEAHGERDENGNLYVPRVWLAIAARRVR